MAPAIRLGEASNALIRQCFSHTENFQEKANEVVAALDIWQIRFYRIKNSHKEAIKKSGTTNR